MVNLRWTVVGLVGALCSSGVLGHPGGNDEVFDLEARAAELRHATRAMSVCAEKHHANGFTKRNAKRRYAKAAALRKERGIKSSTSYIRSSSLNTQWLTVLSFRFLGYEKAFSGIALPKPPSDHGFLWARPRQRSVYCF